MTDLLLFSLESIFFGKGKSPIDMERSQGVKKLLRSSTRVHIIRMHEHEHLRNPFHNPIIRSHRKTSFALSVFFAFNLVMAEHSKFFGIDTLGPVERQSRHRTYKKCKRKQNKGQRTWNVGVFYGEADESRSLIHDGGGRKIMCRRTVSGSSLLCWRSSFASAGIDSGTRVWRFLERSPL